jgi:Domain of unknown function (DUF4936)
VSSRSLYIYFRVERESEVDVVAAVRELQRVWQAAMPGLHCDVLRRADESSQTVTLMETYAGTQGVSRAWQQRIEREAAAKLLPWLVDSRHTEVFEPCA